MEDAKKSGAFSADSGKKDANKNPVTTNDATRPSKDPSKEGQLVKTGKQAETPKVKQVGDHTIQKDDLTTYRGPNYPLF